MGIFTGTPPTYGTVNSPVYRPPMFDFAKTFGAWLKGLIGQQMPGYGGQVDPGLSPTMQMLGRMSQTYGTEQLPMIMGQAFGSLGGMMNPSFTNPVARMEFGAPNYFPQNPGQAMYGGDPYGSYRGLGMMDPNGGMNPAALPGSAGAPPMGAHALPGTDPNAPQGGMPDWLNQFMQAIQGMGVSPQGQGQTPQLGGVDMMPQTGQPGPTLSPTDMMFQPAPPQSQPYAPPPSSWGTQGSGTLGSFASMGGQGASTANAGVGIQGYDASGLPIYAQRASNSQIAPFGSASKPGDADYGYESKGQLRVNPQTGQQEIMAPNADHLGFSWQPFDPNNGQHAMSAFMYQRYGPKWSMGGVNTSHGQAATDYYNATGQAPTLQQFYDQDYGVTPMIRNQQPPQPQPPQPQPAPPRLYQ